MSAKFHHRTDQKLLYAQIHIDEIKGSENFSSNDDWENAHQESAFFHLVGSIETIYHEINEGYSLGLDLNEVSNHKISEKLSQTNQFSPAFNLIKQLRDNDYSWLSILFEWRNHGTHRQHIGKFVRMSTRQKIDNQFKDPRTGKVPTIFSGLGCIQVFDKLVEYVKQLIDDCRRQDPNL